MKLISLSVLLAVSCAAHAAPLMQLIDGAISGGGGKGVVCRAADKSITSVQLLDLWEGQELYNESPVAVTGNLANDVDALLVSLANSYPYMGTCQTKTGSYKGADCVLATLRTTAQTFFGSNANILRLRGVTLTLTDDSYELARPADCNIEQIVNFQPTGRILVNQDLVDKMDAINQTALIAHESLYSFLRDYAGESTSIRTRRAIGYVASGASFVPDQPPTIASSAECTSEEIPSFQNSLRFYSTTINGNPSFGVYPDRLYGSPLMGLGTWHTEFSFDGGFQKYDQTILAGTCTGDGTLEVGVSLEGAGPVESDRKMKLTWKCTNGSVSVFMQGGQIMSDDATFIPLKCTYY
jgi:hypothetical protein